MNHSLRAVAGAALLAASCSLIVDVDSVRRNRVADGGTTDSGVQDAGATDAGAVDAGTMDAGQPDAGVDAGSVDAGADAGMTDAGMMDAGQADSGQADSGFDAGPPPPYDGGTRCTLSTRRRLRCDAPVVLEGPGGGPFSQTNLASLSGALLATYSTASALHIERLEADGGRTPIATEAVASFRRVMASTEGSEWAVVAQTSSADPLKCWSSRNDGGVVFGNPSANPFGVAISSNGAVAVAQGTSSTALLIGVENAGCPAGLTSYTLPFGEFENAGAVHLPGTGTEGFRFVGSGQFNACNGSISLVGLAADGGAPLIQLLPIGGVGPGDVSVVASASGTDVHVLSGDVDCSGNEAINARVMPADFSMPVDNTVEVSGSSRWWVNSSCGAGCAASAVTPASGTPTPRPNLSVLLHSDDGNLQAVGGSDAGWDVLCGVTVDDTSVGMAMDRGRLVFLVGEPTQLRLVRCDVPPL